MGQSVADERGRGQTSPSGRTAAVDGLSFWVGKNESGNGQGRGQSKVIREKAGQASRGPRYSADCACPALQS